MQLKQLFDDDRAVSPVIGVILMVAITVILAAVIGSFVLGLGGQVQNTTPRATVGFETANLSDDGTNDTVTITHEGGDNIDTSNLDVTVSGIDVYVSGDGNPNDYGNLTVTGWDSDSISAGSQVTIIEDGSSGAWDSGDTTVRVIYNDPGSDKSSIIREFTFKAD